MATRIILKTLSEIKFWRLFLEKAERTQKEVVKVLNGAHYTFILWKLEQFKEKYGFNPIERKTIENGQILLELKHFIELNEFSSKRYSLLIHNDIS